MSVTAPAGFEAGGPRAGSRTGRARPRDRRHRRPACGAGGGRVHHEPRVRGAGAGEPRAPRPTGAPPRSCCQLGQRERGHRGAGARRRAPDGAAHRRGPGRAPAPTCSCAPPASSATSCRWTPLESGIPALARRPQRRGGRGRRDPHHRHRAQGGGGRGARARPRSSAAWRRARRCSPGDGDDARGRHHRRRLEPDRALRGVCSPRSTTRSTSCCVDGCTSTNDTVLVLANGASGVDRRRPSWPRSPTRSRRSAARWPSRWPVTPRVRRSWRGSRRGAASLRRRPARRPAGRGIPAGPVLAQRRGPLLGPGALGARGERRGLRPGAGDDLVQRDRGVPRRHRRRDPASPTRSRRR